MPENPAVDPGPDHIPPSASGAAAPPVIDNARGASWMMMSVITASIMTIAVRMASEGMDSRVIVAYRSIGGLLICAAAMIFIKRLRSRLHFGAPWLHIWRGALIGVSTHFGFYTIANLPLATSTVLFFTAPIITALLSIPLQGEKIGPRRGGAIIAGFIGVLIVMRPGVEGINFAMVSAIISSTLFGIALLSSRGLANQDGPFATFVSSAVMTVIVSLPFAAPVWSIPESGYAWLAIILVAVTSLARSIGDIQAYRLAEAAILAPLTYLRLIFLALAGYVFFAETPDIYTIIGGAVIIASALYIAQRERLMRRRTVAEIMEADQNR